METYTFNVMRNPYHSILSQHTIEVDNDCTLRHIMNDIVNKEICSIVDRLYKDLARYESEITVNANFERNRINAINSIKNQIKHLKMSINKCGVMPVFDLMWRFEDIDTEAQDLQFIINNIDVRLINHRYKSLYF